MNATLASTPTENLDAVMLKVARDLAMDIYELDDILKNNNVEVRDFHRWSNHPQFLKYYKSEKEAWAAATNAAERTKVKAGIVMEMFMDEAHANLHNNKVALRERVELAKLVGKVAGLVDRPAVNFPGAGGPGGFRLEINIGPVAGVPRETITVSSDNQPVIEHQDEPFYAIDEEDDYDPFTSPNTLED